MSRLYEASQRGTGQRIADEDEPTPVATVVIPPTRPVTVEDATQLFPRERPRPKSEGRTSVLPPVPPRTLPAALAAEASTAPIEIHSDNPNAQKLVTASVWQPSFNEYRHLAATLLQSHAEKPGFSLLVTSAVPGEGKTLTSANLALTLADAYDRRVLLIDADMRRPALHTLLGVQNGPGLGECLKQGRYVASAGVNLGKGLTLLPAGRPERDPVGQLSSPRFKEFLDDVSKQFECVVFDTPPAVLLPDAELLTAVVDSVLLVVQAGRTPYQQVQRAVASLGRERITGVILNQMVADGSRDKQYREYYSRFNASA